ncbi:recombinase family protein [Acinetobacter baumannii]|nr:recombinase family protein [Acinetobacter baumannii]
MAEVAYIRVSSIGQNTERQLADTGITFDKTFKDEASGKNTDREGLKDMLDYVREGDTVHVHSIDRLGRSLVDLKTLVTQLNNKGVSVNFHKEKLAFEVGKKDDLQNLMFSMLGAFAEFERSMIKERQMEGVAKAKAKGVYNKDKRKKVDYSELNKAIESGMSYRQVAEKFNVGVGTVDRAVKAHKKELKQD